MDRIGMDFADAKHSTDGLVSGTPIELEFDSELAASNFRASAALPRVPDLILMSGPGIERMVDAILDVVETDQQYRLTPLDAAEIVEDDADSDAGE